MAKSKKKNRSRPPKGGTGAATKAKKAAPNPASAAGQRARRAKKAKRDRLLLIGAVAAVVAVVVGIAVFASRDEAGVTEAAAFDLPALDGSGEDGDSRVRLADYEGKPLVVNFFASWCIACESELPRFRAAAETFDDDVEILFVNSNETGNWRPMAERTGIVDQPLVKDINGSNGNGLYRSLGGTGGMPLTAFYDGAGNVIHVDLGELSSEALTLRLQEFYGLNL